MTPTYEVRIYPNFLSYEVTAENKVEAFGKAYELATKESHHDMLKRADYEAEEVN